MYSTALLTTLLPLLATAAPLTSRTSPLSTSQRFTLIAKQTSPSPTSPYESFSVDNLALGAAHSGAGQATGILITQTNSSTNLTPFPFYQNATSSDFANGFGQITGDVGQDPIRSPYGFVIGEYAPHALAINMVNYGTPDVSVAGVNAQGEGRPFVNVNRFDGRQTSVSQFYACLGELNGEKVPEVMWREEGEETPEGCVELALVPQCDGDVTVTSGKEFVQETACYADVETEY